MLYCWAQGRAVDECSQEGICPRVYLCIHLGNFVSWRVSRGPFPSAHPLESSIQSEASSDAVFMLISFLHGLLLPSPNVCSLKLLWMSTLLKRKLTVFSSISRSACHKLCQLQKGLIRGLKISPSVYKEEGRQVSFPEISILSANEVLSQMPSGLGLAHKIVDDEHVVGINLMADLESWLLREWGVGEYPLRV